MYYSYTLNDWNKPFVRDIYIPRIGVAMTVRQMILYYHYSFLLGFKCTFQLYSERFPILLDGYRYHVTLCISQLQAMKMYITVFVCALLCFWVSLCVHLTNYFTGCYFITVVARLLMRFLWPFYPFGTTHLWLGRSGSATTHLPGCFFPWAFSLSMLTSYSFMSCLDDLIELTTCLMYVGPLFGNLVWNDIEFISVT